MRARPSKAETRAQSARHAPKSLDKTVFFRPIAHRGLHDAKAGVIENSAPAFEHAMAKGYGIECDLQPAADGTPIVFHDAKLDRLIGTKGALADHSVAELRAMAYRDPVGGAETRILSFVDFLKLVSGATPLLVEVKGERGMPPDAFLAKIAAAARGYKGPIALMSFNMDVVVALGRLAPKIPRGLVLGRHQVIRSWLTRAGRASEGTALSRILDAAADKVSFFAVEVKVLKDAAAWRNQSGRDVALFSWTIRNKRQRATAERYADAPIFEGYEA